MRLLQPVLNLFQYREELLAMTIMKIMNKMELQQPPFVCFNLLNKF
jgi:hypothetical protein